MNCPVALGTVDLSPNQALPLHPLAATDVLYDEAAATVFPRAVAARLAPGGRCLVGGPVRDTKTHDKFLRCCDDFKYHAWVRFCFGTARAVWKQMWSLRCILKPSPAHDVAVTIHTACTSGCIPLAPALSSPHRSCVESELRYAQRQGSDAMPEVYAGVLMRKKEYECYVLVYVERRDAPAVQWWRGDLPWVDG